MSRGKVIYKIIGCLLTEGAVSMNIVNIKCIKYVL